MNISVAILMGSKSDLEVMKNTFDILEEFGVKFEHKILSAHRNPDLVREFVKDAQDRGTKVFIAGAGMAAHLAGVVASITVCPVIGVPLSGSDLNGLDSLLSTVQMPGGVPVATVAIGKAGAKNAGVLAVQILAVSDDALKQKLIEYKKKIA
ncbi:5-(carboxyamino)imidazole ribonucleotide mutase, partial [bacterium]|nr:5-(carboxyamino)imidazole ribonucleotide mutase [bacterium]